MEEIQLNKICIDSKERNKGFGTILLNKFIQKAYEQNYKKIFLEVNENNIAALKMYQKAGFKYNRIRKKIYDNINNGIEMILHLA
jgi:ribosomal-protein-alanine N-acetyltransferase